MVKFKISDVPESVRSRTKGAAYPPLAVNSAEQAVAMKDATIRLKLQMLKLAAKYF